MPGDAVLGGGDDGYRAVRRSCMVMMGDGSWRSVMLLAWRRDRLGRWVALLEWHAEGGTWEEPFLASRDKMRPG